MASVGAARVSAIAAIGAACMAVPAVAMIWLPIVLGVPHLANDVRFLVLPLPRRQIAIAAVACGALVAMRAATIALGRAPLWQLEAAAFATWLVAALVAARARAALGPAALVAALVIAMPVRFAAIAAIVHNVVAVIAWLVLARPRRARGAIAAIAIVAVIAALAGPAIARWTGADAGLDRAAAALFGAVPHARGLLIALVFLQAIHYAIWLAWLPAGAVRFAAPRALPRWLAIAVSAGVLVVVAAALVDPAWARATYLALATCHIYLELVVLATYLVRRR